VLGGRQYRNVDLYLGAVGWISDDSGAHLGGRAAECLRIGPDRVVAAERFEVRSHHLGRNRPCEPSHTTGPSRSSSRAQSRLMIDW
jgi:hypothetical protein